MGSVIVLVWEATNQMPILIKPFLYVIAFRPIAVLFAGAIGLVCWLLITCVRAIAWLPTAGQRLRNSANLPRRRTSSPAPMWLCSYAQSPPRQRPAEGHGGAHVHVHEGGQAIVGNVESRGDGSHRKRRNNPVHLPMHQAPRCRARTRRDSPCQSPAMKNGRCRMHGGPSPGAAKGNKNALKHGRYTAQAMERRPHRDCRAPDHAI